VASDQSLRACLRIGNCFLDRSGNLTIDKLFNRLPK
jgi:hypothetical protein